MVREEMDTLDGLAGMNLKTHDEGRSMTSRMCCTRTVLGLAWLCGMATGVGSTRAADDGREARNTLTGKEALGDWTTDAPGVRRKITAADLATPYETPSANNFPRVVKRPEGAWPKAPEGFEVTAFATGLTEPRVIVRAPNGDLFLSESRANRIRVLRDADGDGKPEVNEVFATGLERPFGIAFYPVGPEPKYLYVGNTGSVVRFAYANGDTRARSRGRRSSATSPRGESRLAAADTGPATWNSPPTAGRCLSRSARGPTSPTTGVRSGGRTSWPLIRTGRTNAYTPGASATPWAGEAPEDRAALDLGQRARPPRRPPRPRLHHARGGRRFLWLAVVLPGAESRSSSCG